MPYWIYACISMKDNRWEMAGGRYTVYNQEKRSLISWWCMIYLAVYLLSFVKLHQQIRQNVFPTFSVKIFLWGHRIRYNHHEIKPFYSWLWIIYLPPSLPPPAVFHWNACIDPAERLLKLTTFDVIWIILIQ